MSLRLQWFAVMLLVCLAGAAAAQKSPSTSKSKPGQLDCLSCHSDPSLTSDSGGPGGKTTHSVAVDKDKFGNSIHGVLGCNDCHADINDYPHEPAPAKVNCAGCHADAQAAYDRSVHAKALQKDHASRAAACLDCHGKPHEIVATTDPASPVSRGKLPQTCGGCHGVNFVMQSAGLTAQPFVSYEQSVHGKAAAAGNQKAAVCVDCHGNHEILPAGDTKSPIFKFNVPNTCGQCHAAVKQQFAGSIHAQALARGNWQAPVCTDCHGIHSIKGRLDPNSPVAAQNIAIVTCAQCHESMRLSQEFGVPGRRASSYLGSYHGMASKLGSQVVANCASCHGSHDILPSSDPHSSISPARLVETCGQCHTGAGKKFALSKVHVDVPLSRDAGTIGSLWVRRVYIVIISLTIGLMLLHNFLLWRRTALARLREQDRSIERMSRNQRIQHALLFTSFFVLAITGFALKYPDSWVAGLLGFSEVVRRIGHRVAAVVLIGVGAYHVAYIFRNREGRRLFRDFLPRVTDLRNLCQTLLFALGRRPSPAANQRFSYAEKFEYLSLIWGTLLMAITGFMLWFPTLISRLLPRWWVDIAATLHFYEAVLAVLAIIVWHFYFVLFDPDIYPVNWAFWDGKVSQHYLQSHHAGLFAPGTRAVEGATEKTDPQEHS
jgi:cytochrome b subunit of formate dehydrogenase